MDTLQERYEGERRPKDKVTLWNLSIYTYMSQNNYTRSCKCKNKYIHINNVSVKSLDM